jgi:hypothetical protein
MGRTNQPTVSVCKDEDYRGGCQAADLEQDEHDVVAMQGKRTNEHAAEEPHHPGATTDTRGTVFLREMDNLWQVGEHRDPDSHAAEDSEQPFPPSRSCTVCAAVREDWPRIYRTDAGVTREPDERWLRQALSAAG